MLGSIEGELFYQGRIYRGGAGGCAPRLVVSSPSPSGVLCLSSRENTQNALVKYHGQICKHVLYCGTATIQSRIRDKKPI